MEKGPSFHSRQITNDLIFHLSVNVGLFTLTLKLIQVVDISVSRSDRINFSLFSYYENILDIFKKEIRSVLEYNSIIFYSGLMLALSEKIESIQRNFLCNLSSYLAIKFSYSEARILYGTELYQAAEWISVIPGSKSILL